MLATAQLDSPLGILHLQASDLGVRAVSFGLLAQIAASATPAARAHLEVLARELDEYFAGTRTSFELPLDPVGTEFQQRVWRELVMIPHGTTRSYLDIARALGNPNASRAVGLANASNPIAIVVPCHRVIGSSGTLTGYAGELWRKQWLLEHEGAESKAGASLFRGGNDEPCAAARRFKLPC
jgi:methylated-DNA-[protein]-cysteine S-methyltransferase